MEMTGSWKIVHPINILLKEKDSLYKMSCAMLPIGKQASFNIVTEYILICTMESQDLYIFAQPFKSPDV